MGGGTLDAASKSDKPAENDEEVVSPIRRIRESFQARIIGGLIFALPIVITFWIVYWIYSTLQRIILDPTAGFIRHLAGLEDQLGLPYWWRVIASPLIAIGLALVFLYVLGYFARSRIDRILDWLLSRVPLVTVVYKAVRNVIHSLDAQRRDHRPQRVVLVPFPHPGTKAVALVTNTIRDAGTGENILCVYVMTAIVPPAGFTLFVPESEAIELGWTTNDAFQTILSGGLTAPASITYHDPSKARQSS